MTNLETAVTLRSLEDELPGIGEYASQRTTVLDTKGTPTVPAWFQRAQSAMLFDGQDFAYLP